MNFKKLNEDGLAKWKSWRLVKSSWLLMLKQYKRNLGKEIVVFQARFGEWKLRISGERRKLIKIARKSGGTSLKSRSTVLKSYSNGLKSKQGQLLPIQIEMSEQIQRNCQSIAWQIEYYICSFPSTGLKTQRFTLV